MSDVCQRSCSDCTRVRSIKWDGTGEGGGGVSGVEPRQSVSSVAGTWLKVRSSPGVSGGSYHAVGQSIVCV